MNFERMVFAKLILPAATNQPTEKDAVSSSTVVALQDNHHRTDKN
jgi:hypothetical protein